MLSRLVGGGMADVEVGRLELLATLVACFAQAVAHGTRLGPSAADCFGGERNRKREREELKLLRLEVREQISVVQLSG